MEEHKKEYVREECKSCERRLARQLASAKKKASPKPAACQCCGKQTDELVVDHDHSTGEFRGWLCSSCNIGIGKLGDTKSGVEKALLYLLSGQKCPQQNPKQI